MPIDDQGAVTPEQQPGNPVAHFLSRLWRGRPPAAGQQAAAPAPPPQPGPSAWRGALKGAFAHWAPAEEKQLDLEQKQMTVGQQRRIAGYYDELDKAQQAADTYWQKVSTAKTPDDRSRALADYQANQQKIVNLETMVGRRAGLGGYLGGRGAAAKVLPGVLSRQQVLQTPNVMLPDQVTPATEQSLQGDWFTLSSQQTPWGEMLIAYPGPAEKVAEAQARIGQGQQRIANAQTAQQDVARHRRVTEAQGWARINEESRYHRTHEKQIEQGLTAGQQRVYSMEAGDAKRRLSEAQKKYNNDMTPEAEKLKPNGTPNPAWLGSKGYWFEQMDQASKDLVDVDHKYAALGIARSPELGTVPPKVGARRRFQDPATGHTIIKAWDGTKWVREQQQ